MLGRIELDAASQIPLYRQLFLQMRRMIASGELRQGDRLPATRELAGLLGLNRTTVTAAYELLQAEGLIQGRVGRGSFVAASPRPSSMAWEEILPPLEAPPPPPSAELISFAASRPSQELFPIEELCRIAQRVLSGPQAAAVLQLGSPAGYPPLRRYLLESARRRGAARAGDDVIVTSGCQQALDLLQRVLTRPGDRVIVEDPVYPGLKTLFLRAGVQLVGAPVGPQGVDPEELGRLIERHKPRLIVVTPNFQNPTGATLPASSREAVLRLARAAGAVLVENDIYGELRYQGEAEPSIKQLDESGDTVLLGSFSKIAFPGLRVGWVTGPKPLLARLAEAKQFCDLHADQLSQALLLAFAESGGLEAHLERVRAAGAAGLRALLAAGEKHFPEGTLVSRPRGGMNLWVRLPPPLDAAELLGRARREGVGYLPGRYFEVSRHDPGALRLSFAGLAPERIRRGVEILGRIFREEYEQARAGDRLEPAPAMV